MSFADRLTLGDERVHGKFALRTAAARRNQDLVILAITAMFIAFGLVLASLRGA